MDRFRFAPDFEAQLVERRGKLHCFDALDPKKAALVVVDLQTGFLKEGWPTALPSARDVVPTVNRLARVVRATGGTVVWVVWRVDPDSEKRWRIFFDHVMGPKVSEHFRRVFSPGHEGQTLWPELDYQAGETIVEKANFSGFSGSRGRLEAYLRGRGLDTLLIAGTVTNICCESTAREAAFLEFKTIMVSDANAGHSATDNAVTFTTFMSFGDVMSSDEIIERLTAPTLQGDS